MRTLPVLLLMLVIFTPQLHGQEAAPLQLPEQGDVRIIVDISGSMKANDPENLRQPAVRLLARLLPQGTLAGVWTFGQWVNMLVPHGAVDDGWRRNAVEKSREINSVALRTNLGAALDKASDAYLSGEDLSNTDFILLTDGKVDLSDDAAVNAAERERILGPLLAGLIERGATLHTVALSEEADLEMLRALAAGSGGLFSLASSAEDLNRAFLQSLNAAVPQEQIPLDEEGFRVDDGVEEFTALIFWGEEETSATRSLELINPAGERFSKSSVADNMAWSAETGYDLMTVTSPEAGQWQVDGELGEGSRVTVVSDLRMVVSPVPTSFTADAPINLQVAFFEQDARIQNPDFLNVIDVIVRLTASDGRRGSKVLNPEQPPEDGVYTDKIESLPAAGDYDIEVIADGTTFSRQFSAVTRFIAPEASIATPIDISEVEAPVVEPVVEAEVEPEAEETVAEPVTSEPAESGEAAEGMPLWAWGLAGGAGLLALVAGAWAFLRRKKADPEDSEAETRTETRETLEDLEPEDEDVAEDLPPIVEPEPEPEPEPELESDETVPELEPEPEPEAEPDPEPEPEPDDFGLEDFDLSEFDDLPDSDETSPEDPEDDRKKGE